MVVNLIKPFGSILKVKDVDIYNTVFKIHTKLTVVILMVFTALVSTREFFGSPIHCLIDNKDLKEFTENNCWIQGTFTLRNVTEIDERGRAVLKMVPEYQKYYQWIVVVLTLQAILCCVPAYLWKGWEHGRVKELCKSLGLSVLSAEYKTEAKRIVEYLRLDNSRVHSVYVLRYIICEVMNFLIVVFNMCFLNAIFHQFWTRYATAIWALVQGEGALFSEIANDIFPKLAKCTYSDYGPSGTRQVRDALCLLSLNVLNEKIFAFLYVWFLILLFISGCNLISRSILLISATLRLKVIRSQAMSSSQSTQFHIEIILRDEKIGNWFMLYQLGRNLNPIVFKEILEEVAQSKRMLNNENF